VSFTLLCVMCKGKKRDYTPKYVHRLRNMVALHTKKPFRVVCLTDHPDKMPEGVEGIKIMTDYGYRGWWNKIKLFDPALPISGRVLYLDLDVLAVGDLDPIIDFPADFAIAPDSAPTFTGKDQFSTVKGYQSSVMVWDHNARSQFFTEFDPDVREYLWGDQDYLKQVSPNEKTFPGEWFARLSPDGPAKWTDQTKVVLCVKWKNAKAIKEFPWFRQYWI
jgi:hypothetical protein